MRRLSRLALSMLLPSLALAACAHTAAEEARAKACAEGQEELARAI